jgi:hypothetical protein
MSDQSHTPELKPPDCMTVGLCGLGKEPRDNAGEGGSMAYTPGFAVFSLGRLLDRFGGWLVGWRPTWKLDDAWRLAVKLLLPQVIDQGNVVGTRIVLIAAMVWQSITARIVW